VPPAHHLELLLKIERVKARLARWRNQEPSPSYNRGSIEHHRRQAERELRELEDEMLRKGLDDDVTTATNDAQWPWRVCKGSLNFGGKLYARGQVVPDAEVEGCANRDVLIAGGHLRRMAAPFVRPAPPPYVPRPAAPVEDPITVAQKAIRAMALKRGVSRRTATDLIDHDVLTRAIKAVADTPREVEQGAWGSGRMRVQAGRGTSRRPTDDAIEILIADEPQPSAA
jgi:hypothetical protein